MRRELVGTVLAASLVACSSDGVQRTGDLVGRAHEVCTRFAERVAGPGAVVTVAGGGDATSAARTLRQLGGQDGKPWSELPPEHFVAQCNYDTTGSLATARTGVPLEPPPEPRIVAFFVDEEGRSTPLPIGPG